VIRFSIWYHSLQEVNHCRVQMAHFQVSPYDFPWFVYTKVTAICTRFPIFGNAKICYFAHIESICQIFYLNRKSPGTSNKYSDFQGYPFPRCPFPGVPVCRVPVYRVSRYLFPGCPFSGTRFPGTCLLSKSGYLCIISNNTRQNRSRQLPFVLQLTSFWAGVWQALTSTEKAKRYLAERRFIHALIHDTDIVWRYIYFHTL
jgi:hypothetical protein